MDFYEEMPINNKDESSSQEDGTQTDGTELTDEEIMAQLDAVENGEDGTSFFQELFKLVKDAYNVVMNEFPCDTESCRSESSVSDSGEAGLGTPSDSGRDERYHTESSPSSVVSNITTSSPEHAVANLPQLAPSAKKDSFLPLVEQHAQSSVQPKQLFYASSLESHYQPSPSSIASAKSIQQNSIADLVSIAGTSIISDFLTDGLKKKPGDMASYFTKHRMGGDVVKSIAKCMYKKDVKLDVRKAMSPESSAEKEMQVILGKVAAAYASSGESKCYLCGGTLTGRKVEISSVDKRIDEVDHKVPCKTFYAMFRFVKREFPDEYSEWIQYIKSDYIVYIKQDKTPGDRLEYVYSTINNSSELTDETLNRAFEQVEDGFSNYLKNRQITFPDGTMARFNRIVRAYLLEFAYTHHVCNQVKSDNDLSVDEILNKYYEILIDIVTSKDIMSWKNIKDMPKNYRNPACLIYPEIAKMEFDKIRSGLGITGKKNSATTKTLADRKNLVKLEISTIMKYGLYNAIDLNLSMKRSMIRAIREILSVQKITGVKQVSLQANAMKNILKPTGERFNAANKFCAVMSKELVIAMGTRGMGPRATNQLKAKILNDWDRFENMFIDSYDLLPELNNINMNKSSIKPAVIKDICERAEKYVDKLRCINDKMTNRLKISQYKTWLGDENLDTDTIMSEIKAHLDAINYNINNLCSDNIGVAATAPAPATMPPSSQSLTQGRSLIMSIDDLANNIFGVNQSIMNHEASDTERGRIIEIIRIGINSGKSSEDIANSIVSQYTYGKFTDDAERNYHAKSMSIEKGHIQRLINNFLGQPIPQSTPEKPSSARGQKRPVENQENADDLFTLWSNEFGGGLRKRTTRRRSTRKRRPSKKPRRTIRRHRRNKKGTQKRRK